MEKNERKAVCWKLSSIKKSNGGISYHRLLIFCIILLQICALSHTKIDVSEFLNQICLICISWTYDKLKQICALKSQFCRILWRGLEPKNSHQNVFIKEMYIQNMHALW